jgi:hypothetical protein
VQKPYLASFRRFCAWCFNMIHRHIWIYKAHILTKSTERASLQLQSTASIAISQNAAFTTVVEDQHNLLGPHTSTYIIRRTDLLIQATKMESAWKNETQIVFHPSSPQVLLSSRLHLQILGFPDNVL